MKRISIFVTSVLAAVFFATVSSASAQTANGFVAAAKRIRPSIVGVRAIFPYQVSPNNHVQSGTGIIMSAEGDILTNAHIVRGAERIDVLVGSYRYVSARLMGMDLEKDLARLSIVPPRGVKLVPAKRGDSLALRVGNAVMKCGYPGAISSRDPSFAQGIVVNERVFFGNQTVPLIATDVQLSGGDSGGPLFNAKGQVVGIDVASSIGIASYAIPIHVINGVWDKLAHGVVRTGWLGFMAEQVLDLRDIRGDEFTARNANMHLENLGIPQPAATINEGFMIMAFAEQFEDKIAHAGLEVGDIITRYKERMPRDASELVQWITETEPGTEAVFRGFRGNIPMLLRLVVQEWDWTVKVVLVVPQPQGNENPHQ